VDRAGKECTAAAADASEEDAGIPFGRPALLNDNLKASFRHALSW
jgi:hypothetical protein